MFDESHAIRSLLIKYASTSETKEVEFENKHCSLLELKNKDPGTRTNESIEAKWKRLRLFEMAGVSTKTNS
jgi:hypothetical protein